MGYELHITRQENWFDENDALKITQEEWVKYISTDTQMRLDGFTEITLPDGKLFRQEDPGMAVWTGYSRNGLDQNYAWIWLGNGNIEAKNPDPEIIRKLLEIAHHFQAKVQGDDGELYTQDDLESDDIPLSNKSEESKKPWWKFW